MSLLLIILQILFPNDIVRELIECVRDFLHRTINVISDEATRQWMASHLDDPNGFILLERWLDDTEGHIDLIIHLRARQLLGHVIGRIPVPRQTPDRRRKARTVEDLLQRIERIGYRFAQIERLATLRAPKLKRLLEADPLGLAPHHPIEGAMLAFSSALAAIAAPMRPALNPARAFTPEHIRAPP